MIFRPRSPDFERYADQKTFNERVAPGWELAFDRALVSLDKPQQEVCFLDVGCGDGKNYRYLVRKGLDPRHIHGVEVSRTRVQRCHDLGWVNVAHVEDGVSLPYADASMDVVQLMEIIEHVATPIIRPLLREVRRVLAPHGHFLISTPNYPIKRFYDISDAFLHGKWIRLRDDPTHISYYNHRTLTALLSDYFSVIEEYSIKDGFVYRHYPRPFFRHKLFFMCGGVLT
jgi:SAM-dependent methyltransferase